MNYYSSFFYEKVGIAGGFEEKVGKTRLVFVKQGCPRQQQSENLARFVSPTF